LDKEIESIDLEVIVPLGYYATQHISKKYGRSTPESKPETFGRIFLAGNKKYFPYHILLLLFIANHSKEKW